VFVVGYLGRQPRSKIFPIGPIHTVSGPEDESNKGRSQAQYSTTLRRNPAKKADDTFIHVIGSLNDKKWQRFNESSRRVYGADGIAPTIPTVSGGGHLPKIADGIRIRKLTPIECERLQGFPDNWTAGFSDTQRYKMAGNAVTVNVVREIISRLV
jgi:site-specific DNA-cytosine methylase